MPASYHLVIDCTSPEPLARFWAEALHYAIAPAPPGVTSCNDWYRSVGVSEDDQGRRRRNGDELQRRL